jgi:hypothetical protein
VRSHWPSVKPLSTNVPAGSKAAVSEQKPIRLQLGLVGFLFPEGLLASLFPVVFIVVDGDANSGGSGGGSTRCTWRFRSEPRSSSC